MRIFLAPMEGVVDFHLRKLYSAFGGIDFCVTEFIRINEHVLPRKVFLKACPELLPENHSLNLGELETHCIPTRVQLLGSNPELLAQNAAKVAEIGACGIDLNFGCPAKTVNRNRGGACLLDETALIYQIVKQVRDAVPETIPVTAKIRLGYNDRLSYLENASAIQDAGATELFVHARSKADGYKPPAYWHMIGDINEQLSIPVIANGEIWNLNDYLQCKNESGCEDFMLGRGLLANPGLAAEIRAHEHGNSTPGKRQANPVDWEKTLRMLHCFFIETSAAYPKKFMGNRVKQWLHYLKIHYPQAGLLFDKIKREKIFCKIEDAILSELRLPQ